MIEEIFEIEIPNEEEFDPTKLQLINSDNEVEQIPFGIVTNQIMYDGEIIKSQNQQCYANKEGFMVICDDYLLYL
jgi:hypothetical protein